MSVTYDDRITIETPENVTLEVTLAGLGSRMAASLIDGLIRFAVILALFIVLLSSPDRAGGVEFALFIVGSFAVFFAYDVLFETLAGGRTPGKRATGLRVVREGGQPVGFVSSAIRNLMRLVDMLPFSYAIGIVAILVSSKNQRLGDMAAGTIVVREVTTGSGSAWREHEMPRGDEDSWDIGGVTQEEIATVRSFLTRRETLDSNARTRIGRELAFRLHAKVPGAPANMSPEEFLRRLAAAKSRRS
jgi:uncharacterized RDD family membrane protein YckC